MFACVDCANPHTLRSGDKMKLGELVDIQTGKLNANAAVVNGKYPFFTTAQEISRINTYSFDDEVVLVAGNGDLNVKYYNGKFDAYQRTYILKKKDNKIINMKYLYYFMEKYLEILRRQSIGCVIKYIKLENLTEPEIYYPSIDTQTKIAKILDKSTALIAKRKAQIAELDTLVQSVFLEMFGDPITNPKKLPKVELSELGIWKSGGTPSRANKAFFTGNIPWITSGELETLYIEDSKEHISEEAVQESAVKEIEIGSILLGMYDTAGLKASITSEVVTCNQAIAFAKLDDDKVNTIFVYYCIQQQKSHLLKQQRGVRQKNFNLSMIKEINVLYPNLNLQTQFAQIVEKIQTQKSQLQQSLTELEIQHQALMQRAFRGELV